ncbi:MAG: hypothetical protein AAGH92_13240 [Planctomycetota bacterium]
MNDQASQVETIREWLSEHAPIIDHGPGEAAYRDLLQRLRPALEDSPSNHLTFHAMRVANVARCLSVYHPVKEWSPTDWATAVAGEVGEACTLIKKRRRGEGISKTAIADELADAVIYLDLLAEALDIDLGGAVVRKFNVVSDRVGSGIKIESDDVQP